MHANGLGLPCRQVYLSAGRDGGVVWFFVEFISWSEGEGSEHRGCSSGFRSDQGDAWIC